MRAMRFPEAGRAEIVEVPTPRVGEGEVLVEVKAAGICASDVAAFRGIHDVRLPPVITGHELAGEIVEVGPGVHLRTVGERVAVEPHLGCGRCVYCQRGHYHECPSKRFLGVGDWSGAFAEFVAVAERMCHVMPPKMTWEEGAALEPLCVGLHAVRRAEVRVGDRVAIVGVGAIGMMTLLCVQCCSPGKVMVTDPNPGKRDMALRCGADVAIDPARQDPVNQVRRLTDGVGADVVFIAVEVESALRQALDLCRPMGSLVIIAAFFQGGALEARQIQARERIVIGTSTYTAEDYALAIRLWERREFTPLPSLITERISLDRAPSMVAELARGERPDTIKAIIRFD